MARIPGVGDSLGPYRITRQLGAGGMGVVFEAVEEGLGRRVALKVLAVQLAEEPEFRSRFLREATVLARSDSPHIIQVYSHGEHDGVLYLATQFVPGGDLAARVASDGLPPADSALDLAAQVASALADAHAVGVVHRDVKPHNVLLRAGQDQVHAYLCDFGIARDDESSLTSSGVVAGTYAYLAPERFRGEPATAASDIYALGCLVWFLLTGRAPYDGGPVQLATQHEFSPIPQLPGAPAQLNAFLQRAMAKDPAARHPSAGAAAAHLRAIRAAGGLPSGQFVAPPQPPVPSYPSSAGSAGSYPPAPPTSPIPSVGSHPSAPSYPSAPSTASVPQAPPPQPVPRPAPHPTPLMPPGRDEPRRRTGLVAALVVLAVLLGVGGGVGWSLLRDDGKGDGSAGDGGDSPSAAGSATGGSSPGSSDSPRSAGAPGPVDGPIAPADVNGDGFDDTILLDDLDDETVVLLSDPRSQSGFGAQQRWSTSAYGDALVVRGDFNGDGWADLALAEPGLVRVAASNGAKFSKPVEWATPDLPDEFRVTAGDFDADGHDDLAFLTGAGTGAISIEVALADGTGFRTPESWAGIDGWTYEDMRIGAADVDGDGRADFVEMGQPPEGGIDIRVFASLAGGTFDANRGWFSARDWSWNTTRIGLGDVDADGDADVVALRDFGGDGLGVATLLSDGTRLEEDDEVVIGDLAFDRTRSVAGDTDGDGTTDLVLVDRNTAEARRYARTSDGFTETGSTSVDAHVDEDGSILVGVSR